MDRQLIGTGSDVHALEFPVIEHGRELVEELLFTGAAHQRLVVEQPEKSSSVDIAQVGGRRPHHRALR